jgi:hypothetical protein
MWADVLTKPLQGAKFCLMRAFLMNCPVDYFENQATDFIPTSNPKSTQTKISTSSTNHIQPFVSTDEPTDIAMKKRSLWSTPSLRGGVETSALKCISGSTSALKPVSASTSALKPVSVFMSALKPVSVSTSALKREDTDTKVHVSRHTPEYGHKTVTWKDTEYCHVASPHRLLLLVQHDRALGA